MAQPAAHLKSVIRIMSSNPIGKLDFFNIPSLLAPNGPLLLKDFSKENQDKELAGLHLTSDYNLIL